MSIEFGQVNHSQPEEELRPDRNAQFATTIVGEIGPSDLPIFVDLDVMRDMEAHSLTDTRVELGGVMLGRQRVDAQGNPFVVIQESLRAEHYHATKGSFTFTHDTWSEITRRRAEFHPELEMVGWYHTHPGWNVFLSGMDNFICDNFFNRPLDVALVIDPCQDDRGWFQWQREQNEDGTQSQATQPTDGFILMTGRHRTQELEYFADLYARENKMTNDPRYSNTPGRETIHVVQTTPSSNHLLLGMLALQLIFMVGLTCWAFWGGGDRSDSVSQQTATDTHPQQTIRQQAQAELLERVVAGQAGNGELATEFTRLKEQEFLLRSSLDGQLARLEKESTLRQQAESELQESNAQGQRLKNDLGQIKTELTLAQKRIDLIDPSAELAADQATSNSDWILLLAGGLSLLAAGGFAGYSYHAKQHSFNQRQQIASDDDMSSFELSEASAAEIEYNERPVATR